MELEGRKSNYVPSEDDMKKKTKSGKDYQLPKAYKEEDDVMKRETDVGWEPSTKVEKITPIKSMTKLKSVQEIKKMTPLNWIEEIISMKKVKSIEEIKEKIAREFIRKHGLKNLIDGDVNHIEAENGPRPYGEKGMEDTDGNIDSIEQELETLEKDILKDEEICDEMTNDVERLKKEISALEKVKQNHCKRKETEITEYEGLKDQLANAIDYTIDLSHLARRRRRKNKIDPELIKSIDHVKAEKVVSTTPLKSVKEIVSMDHVKSLQEVKNLYKLTEEEAQKLKAEVLAARNGQHKRRMFGSSP